MERPDGYDALPKRFRQYIEHLEGRVAQLQKAIPSKVPTGVRVVNRLARSNDEETYLPNGTGIEFRIAEHSWVEVKVAVARDGSGRGTLEVMSHNGGIAIRPEVSNVIQIEVRR